MARPARRHSPLTVGASHAADGVVHVLADGPGDQPDDLLHGGSLARGAGRRIVSYDWDFGSGRTATGVTTTKAYDTPGTYTVTLTVTDDTGQQGTTSQNVTVSLAGALTAALTVSPGTGSTGTNFFFDASASQRGASPIVEYRFTFGDGTPDVVGASPTTTHRYSASGGYTARVTVRDSAGRTATATANVTVQ